MTRPQGSRRGREPNTEAWRDFERVVSELPSWNHVWRFALTGPQSVVAGGAYHTNLCLYLRFGSEPGDAELKEIVLYKALAKRLGAQPAR
jgi:hypothetical protein